MGQSPQPRAPDLRTGIRLILAAGLTLALFGGAAAETFEDALRAAANGDRAKEISILKSLADRGDVRAEVQLSTFYFAGWGVAENPKLGVALLQRAARQNDRDAQAELALAYELGATGPPNSTKAAFWYLRSAKQGSKIAQMAIAQMYQEGRGVPRNDLESFRWYHRAAMSGNRTAQQQVSIAYDQGRGTKQDFILAYMWRAASLQLQIEGIGRATKADQLAIDSLAARMTPKQVDEAKRRAVAMEMSKCWVRCAR